MIESLDGQAGGVIVHVPDYLRVVNSTIEQIRSGKLRPGDPLPSISKLAEQERTGQTTIKTAQALLRAQGWIVGKQGRATYVADNPPVQTET